MKSSSIFARNPLLRFMNTSLIIARVLQSLIILFLPATAALGVSAETVGHQRQRDVLLPYNEVHAQALSGLPAAQYQLALLLEQGRGVPRNRTVALGWMLAAAENGLAPAQFGVWRMLGQDALSTEQDQTQARRWLERAAQNEHPEALYVLYQEKAKAAILPESAGAIELLEAAARRGHAVAQREWAMHLLAGADKGKPYALAAYWLEQSANQGDAPAQTRLGNLYSAGLGLPQDALKAAVLYSRAADQGHAEAMNELGLFFMAGRGVSRNLPAAVALFDLAIKLSDDKRLSAISLRRRILAQMSPEDLENLNQLSLQLVQPGSIEKLTLSALMVKQRR